MKKLFIAFVLGLVCHLSTAPGRASEFQLQHLGNFRLPSGAWEILEQKTGTIPGFTSTVLRNTANGDLLSFAIYEKSGSEVTDMLTLVDTAHELFPDGRFATFSQIEQPYGIWSVRWSITNVLDRTQQVLEFSFVAEHKIPEKNLLAHGYVLIGDVTVFVQHTSSRPTTPGLAQEVASSVLRRLVEKSDTSNLKPSLHDEAGTYQTKPQKLETGQLFFLMFSPKHKQLAYEPCVGFHMVEVLKETPTEFVIRIAGTQGRSLDPLTGQETKVSELKGKIYRIEVVERTIHRISEVKKERKL